MKPSLRSLTLPASLVLGCACATVNPPPGSSHEAQTATSLSLSPADLSSEISLDPRLVHTVTEVGFKKPEAILYSRALDIYLVSNVYGDPSDADGNGFISKLSPEGQIIDLKWIDGSKDGISLSAPKGMAISGDNLYVADITEIRRFNLNTGAPLASIIVPNATFLNGLCADAQGTVYFSDTGDRTPNRPPGPASAGAVYRIEKDGVTIHQLRRGGPLGHPNGLVSTGDRLWSVNLSGDFFEVDHNGVVSNITTLPAGALDGLVSLDDGSFLISSWKASGIYRGRPGEKFRLFLADLQAPASIGYDPTRDRLLVPKMMTDEVLIYQLAPVPVQK